MNTVAPSPAGSELSDNDLFRRFLNGEQEAFASLVRRYRGELYGFLARFLGDGARADDVFQDTFLQVYQSAGLFDPTRPFRPWLYAVAVNKARDALRKESRHPTVPLDAVVPGANGREESYAGLMPANIPSPEELSMNLETRQAVQSMVSTLPDPLREVLVLSYFQALPHKEISEALNIPVGTVKSRLHSAVRLFAETWKTYAARQLRQAQARPPEDFSEGNT
ncbi:MAG: sigma-70 family RNA polymerase sigma factor [Phycisphaerae bacterium]|nr:sigma-70 family RNA polymerase sigma factor [Phycisphaerae bacterium]